MSADSHECFECPSGPPCEFLHARMMSLEMRHLFDRAAKRNDPQEDAERNAAWHDWWDFMDLHCPEIVRNEGVNSAA